MQPCGADLEAFGSALQLRHGNFRTLATLARRGCQCGERCSFLVVLGCHGRQLLPAQLAKCRSQTPHTVQHHIMHRRAQSTCHCVDVHACHRCPRGGHLFRSRVNNDNKSSFKNARMCVCEGGCSRQTHLNCSQLLHGADAAAAASSCLARKTASLLSKSVAAFDAACDAAAWAATVLARSS